MRLALCAILVFCALSGSAYATTIYTDQASFLAAIAPGYYLENFTTFSDGDPLGGDPSPTEYQSSTVNGFSWTLTAPDGLWSLQNGVSAAYPLENLTITFTGAPVKAVGGVFSATDYVGDVIPTASVVVTLADGTNRTVLGSGFVGFTSTTAITSLRITPLETAEGNWSAFRGLYTGVGSVPEPASILSLVMGVVGIASTAGLRRLRRS